jgi:hypothetical protein
VERVSKTLKILYARVLCAEATSQRGKVAAVQVLDEIKTTRAKPVEAVLKRGNDMVGPMRTVVHDNVKRGGTEPIIEGFSIGSVTNKNLDIRRWAKACALRVGIDPIDAWTPWKIFRPDLERTTVLYADFEKVQRLAYREVRG